ncbi:cold-shock protein [Flavobacterium sp. XS1P32]|uniref:cold-shock protein n=1 Tax=Flavobacterium sp. XS1P32 TaxID=3401726 RepID=UPI003AACC96F
MSNKTYNILWIDDKHEELPALHRTAIDYGIKLFPYKSMNGGCEELEKNYNLYDAILLDAKFFENEDDVPGSEDTKWVHRTKDRILQLDKKFAYFVLTAQAKAYASEEFNNAFQNVYEKGISDAEDELFSRLVLAAESQADTQLRHKYQRVFNVCTGKYIGEYAAQDLFSIFKENDNAAIDKHFTNIRKIVEDVFIAFNKFQLLPIEFVSPTVSLNPSSKFLCGQSQHENTKPILKQFILNQDNYLPKVIGGYLKNILSITQPGAHRSEIDAFVKNLKTPYLFHSVLYQLLDLLVWFKEYVDNHPTPENWKILDEVERTNDQIWSVEGIIINFNPAKGFGFLKPLDGSPNIFIQSNHIADHHLTEGMTIIGEAEEYIDNRTGETRNKIKKINSITPKHS